MGFTQLTTGAPTHSSPSGEGLLTIPLQLTTQGAPPDLRCYFWNCWECVLSGCGRAEPHQDRGPKPRLGPQVDRGPPDPPTFFFLLHVMAWILSSWALPGFFFFKILFIHERHREKEADTGRGRSRLHTGSPMPNVGLDPRTPGSCPDLKAGAKLLSHQGIPTSWGLKIMHPS